MKVNLVYVFQCGQALHWAYSSGKLWFWNVLDAGASAKKCASVLGCFSPNNLYRSDLYVVEKMACPFLDSEIEVGNTASSLPGSRRGVCCPRS